MIWTISENGISAENIEFRGNKFMIGNGYMGYRGTLEEYGAEQLTACTLAGLYDQNGGWRELVNAPNPFRVLASVDGSPLSVLEGRTLKSCQSLDLQKALHVRETVFDMGRNQVTVNACRFVSRAQLQLMVMKYSLCADYNCQLIWDAIIDDEIWDLNGPHLRDASLHLHSDCLVWEGRTVELGRPVSVAQTIACNVPDTARGEKGFVLELRVGEPVTFTICAAIYHNRKDSARRARALAETAARKGFSALLTEHASCWQTLWRRVNVEIEGDPEADLALRYNLYLLLCSAPFHTVETAICARGLSGQVYKGAMFWDTELYMFPFFACTLPHVCRNLAQYRVETLAGARRKAREYNRAPGAFYAWESQDTGDEACTPFGFLDVFTGRPLRTHFANKQIHISADVAWGILQYYQASGDDTFLLEGGLEVVLECCRFFWQYSVFRPQQERYELWDVTGPDEYHERVNNNAYTNLLVGEVLDRALPLTDSLQTKYPSQVKEMLSRTGLNGDLENLKTLAQALYRPQPGQDSIIEQFDGYFSLEQVSVSQLFSRKLKEDEYLGGSNGLAAGTQIIKQADVMLAVVLLQDRYTKYQKEANYRYYEPRTEHGSSLSACIYALGAIDCGELEQAMTFFRKGAFTDIQGTYKQRVGGVYIGGVHMAAAGGSWMVAIQGFAGIRAGCESIIIAPRLPDTWNRLSTPFCWRGNELSITVTSSLVTVQAKACNPIPCPVSVLGETCQIAPGDVAMFPINSQTDGERR